jgi:hypothetical protein
MSQPPTNYPLEPIYCFKDHPSRKNGYGDYSEILYLISDNFFIADIGTQPQEVTLTRLDYTNMGEPFRQLARLSYKFVLTGRSDSMEISNSDAAQLAYWHRCRDLPLDASDELVGNREFDAYWQDLINPD